jgi:ABC-type enterochelin transport system ATPase subunit
LNSRKRTAIAVTPWTTTPPIVLPLNALDVPRATPTMIPMIQAAEKSQTIIVAIHHHISITSFSLGVVTQGSIHLHKNKKGYCGPF